MNCSTHVNCFLTFKEKEAARAAKAAETPAKKSAVGRFLRSDYLTDYSLCNERVACLAAIKEIVQIFVTHVLCAYFEWHSNFIELHGIKV